MSCSKFINSPLFTILGGAVAFIFSYQIDDSDLNTLGNWLTFVAAVMLTIAAQRAATDSQQSRDSEISYLKEQIKQLQTQVDRL